MRPVLFAFVASLVLSAPPPPQGHTIRVPRPSTFGATTTEAEAVQTAVKQELEAEGYGVLTSDDAKGHTAIISGSVTKVGGGSMSALRSVNSKTTDSLRLSCSNP